MVASPPASMTNLANIVKNAMRAAKRTAGVRGVYRQGETSVEVTALPAAANVANTAGDVQLDFTQKDFRISICDLQIDGVRITPQAGDTFDVFDSGCTTATRYTVARPDDGSQPWRFADPATETEYRVHMMRGDQVDL